MAMNDHDFSRWRPHPWHGLDIGPNAPRVVIAYIEITPFDMIKYEIDKASGYLMVDRPQRSSSHPPALYGFIPRTYCSTRVARLAPGCEKGDGDPLDICVVSERPIERSEVLLRARVVGGIKLIDRGEADDKIIAVLEGDYLWDHVKDISQLAPVLVERLEHYFSTYKLIPGEPNNLTVSGKYGYEHAKAVIEAARQDYQEAFGDATQERRRT
jgi:inorganic pyrophosphatase